MLPNSRTLIAGKPSFAHPGAECGTAVERRRAMRTRAAGARGAFPATAHAALRRIAAFTHAVNLFTRRPKVDRPSHVPAYQRPELRHAQRKPTADRSPGGPACRPE